MKPKLPSPGIAVAVVVVLAAANGWPAWAVVLAGLAGMAAWYGWSLWRRPLRPCAWCGGSGISTGSDPEKPSDRPAFGKCRVCGGRKGLPRWGLRLFMPETRRAIAAGRKGRNF